MGLGFQFCRTPKIVSMVLNFVFTVKVKGNGPANFRASFQVLKGEPSGILTFSALSLILISKSDSVDLIIFRSLLLFYSLYFINI